MILSGPRRVGKTVLLQQLAAQLIADGVPSRSICYLDLGLPSFRLEQLPDLLALYRQHIWPSDQAAYVLLDEVQYAKDWDMHVKALVDHDPLVRVVATGSAALQQRTASVDSGVGRMLTVPVPTLSFYEYVALVGAPVPDFMMPNAPKDLARMDGEQLRDLVGMMSHLRPLFDRYMLLGGFPEVALRDDIPWGQRLLFEDVVDRVLKRDVVALYKVRNVDHIERLLIYLCRHSGGVFNVEGTAKELGISAITVREHISHLEMAHLIYRVASERIMGKGSLKSKNKYYIADASMLNAVLSRGEEVLRDATMLGHLAEGVLLRHLLAFEHPRRPVVRYGRGPDQQEVDFILSYGEWNVPIEMKYREDASLDRAPALMALIRAQQPPRAYLVSKHDHDTGVQQIGTTTVVRMPLHALCLQIGEAERMAGPGEGRSE